MLTGCIEYIGELRKWCTQKTIEGNKNRMMLESHQIFFICFRNNCFKGIEKEETDLLGHSTISDFKNFPFLVSSCCHNKLLQI